MMTYEEVLHHIEELGLEVTETTLMCGSSFADMMLFVKFDRDITLLISGEGLGIDLAFSIKCDFYELSWPNYTDADNMSNELKINRTGTRTFFEGQLDFFLNNCVRRMIG